MGRGVVAAVAAIALVVGVQGGVLGQTAGWPTYQHDPSCSGVDPNQGAVTTIAAAWTSNLDARVYA